MQLGPTCETLLRGCMPYGVWHLNLRLTLELHFLFRGYTRSGGKHEGSSLSFFLFMHMCRIALRCAESNNLKVPLSAVWRKQQSLISSIYFKAFRQDTYSADYNQKRIFHYLFNTQFGIHWYNNALYSI